jgi:hypothetical protein
MARYRVGIPQLMWVYVDVEVDDQETEDETREEAIEKAYENAPSDICAWCMGWDQKEWSREGDELGSLVGTRVKLEHDVERRE